MNAPEPLLSRAAAPLRHRIGVFELQSVLAHGPTGFVYRAWDHALARPVAIKEYLPIQLARRGADRQIRPVDDDAAGAFERGRVAFIDEARALARCDQPSLVRVLHLVEADGTAYRVMPLYAGRTLLEVRRAMAGPPDEAALRVLLDDLLGALEAFHLVAGAHGAVGAGQVLLLEDDRAVLLGTGAAARAARPAGDDPVVATPSAAADLHALAAIARWCITGDTAPAAGLGVAEPLAATVDRMFFDQPAVQYGPEILRALDIALSPDVARRPRHAAQLREWLTEPAAAPAVAPVVPAAPVDSATAGAIRRAIDSIPQPMPPPVAEPPPVSAPVAALPPPSSPVAALSLRAVPRLDDGRGMAPFRAEPARGGRRTAWSAVALILLATAGYAAWRFPLPTWPIAGERAAPSEPVRPPAAAPAAAPEAAAAAPAPVAAASAAMAAAPPLAEAASAPAAPVGVVQVPVPVPVDLGDPAAAVGRDGATGLSSSTGPALPLEPPIAPAEPAAPRAKSGKPPAKAAPARPERRVAASPREACGGRTDFALYRCMQQQCASAAHGSHAQCARLRATDRVE